MKWYTVVYYRLIFNRQLEPLTWILFDPFNWELEGFLLQRGQTVGNRWFQIILFPVFVIGRILTKIVNVHQGYSESQRDLGNLIFKYRGLSFSDVSGKPGLDAHWTGSHHVTSSNPLATGSALIGQAYIGYSDPCGQASREGKERKRPPLSEGQFRLSDIFSRTGRSWEWRLPEANPQLLSGSEFERQHSFLLMV